MSEWEFGAPAEADAVANLKLPWSRVWRSHTVECSANTMVRVLLGLPKVSRDMYTLKMSHRQSLRMEWGIMPSRPTVDPLPCFSRYPIWRVAVGQSAGPGWLRCTLLWLSRVGSRSWSVRSCILSLLLFYSPRIAKMLSKPPTSQENKISPVRWHLLLGTRTSPQAHILQ